MFRKLFRRSQPPVPESIAPASREPQACRCGSIPPAFEGGLDEDSTSRAPGYISESELPRSDSFEPAIQAANPECKSLTAAGEPCLAPARKVSGFCIFHDPAYRAAHRANSVLGGQASARARHDKEAEATTACFADPESRRFLLGYLLEGQIRGKLTQAQTSAMLRTFQLLFRAEQPFR